MLHATAAAAADAAAASWPTLLPVSHTAGLYFVLWSV